MHFEDLAPAPEVTNHLEYVLPHRVTALRPSSHAERQPPVFAVSGNLLSSAIAVHMGEELCHSIHSGQRRIVRMQGQLHSGFLSDWQDRFEEVGVMVPNLFGRVFALEL